MKIFVFALLILTSCLSQADQVLIIGDSHSCGQFGDQLVNQVGENGRNSVTMLCSPGTSVQHWTQGFVPKNPANHCMTFTNKNHKKQLCGGNGNLPAIGPFLSATKPDRFIIALGTNNLAMNGLKHFSILSNEIQRSQAKCSWIGPPTLGTQGSICINYGHNFLELVSTIQRSAEPTCNYIDSRKWTTADTTPDCLHRFGQAAIVWANGVATEIISSSGLSSVVQSQKH
jgi:hypothetical protein